MGQTYYVHAKFDIKDEAAFVREGRKTFERPYVTPIAEDRKDTAEHLIETLLAKHQKFFVKAGNSYRSEFDASYGWEAVLSDFFDRVRGTLNKGSYMKVYPDPDNGNWMGSWMKTV